MVVDELTRRAHLQAAVRVVVVVFDPCRELGQVGQGIRAGLDAGVGLITAKLCRLAI